MRDLSCILCPRSDTEAVRFLESVQDLLFQKYQSDSAKTKSDESLFKKIKRKLTKKDISAPCNFKHVSGIKYMCCCCCCYFLLVDLMRQLYNEYI